VIHPTALVHPNAKLNSTVQVGPYTVIDEGVEVGPECVIGPQVYLTGLTRIGGHNRIFAGCVIGEAPQDLKYKDEPTRLRIGDYNVFREHVTIHRSTKVDEDTVVGSHNFLMQHSHVAHNVSVGNHVILGGGSLLAGHATVGDRALISGNCLIHQFTRVGALALMQGGSAISKDLAPFTVARGYNRISGLNTIGLRRAGLSSAERIELRRLYHFLFRSGLNLREAAAKARMEFISAPALLILDFIANSKRGVCADLGRRRAGGTDPADEA
jgi:UDP-N-acetylglucosamine acyltransferase